MYAVGGQEVVWGTSDMGFMGVKNVDTDGEASEIVPINVVGGQYNK